MLSTWDPVQGCGHTKWAGVASPCLGVFLSLSSAIAEKRVLLHEPDDYKHRLLHDEFAHVEPEPAGIKCAAESKWGYKAVHVVPPLVRVVLTIAYSSNNFTQYDVHSGVSDALREMNYPGLTPQGI